MVQDRPLALSASLESKGQGSDFVLEPTGRQGLCLASRHKGSFSHDGSQPLGHSPRHLAGEKDFYDRESPLHRVIASWIPYHFHETCAGSALRRKCLYGRCGVFAPQCLEPGPRSSPSSQEGVPQLPAPCGSCPAYDPHFRGLLLPCPGHCPSAARTSLAHAHGRAGAWSVSPGTGPAGRAAQVGCVQIALSLPPQSAALFGFFTPEDVVIVTRHEGARVFSLLSPQCGRVCGLTQRLHELWRRNVLCRRTCDGEGFTPSYRAASFVPVFHAQALPCTKAYSLRSPLSAPRRSHPW